MTRTNWLIVGFWAFIVIGCTWQCSSYNTHLDKETEAHPVRGEFFFYHSKNDPAHGGVATVAGAQVQQLNYWTEPETPSSGMFTSHVVLKNTGSAKATAVEIWVRPYKGIYTGDEDNGRSSRPEGNLSDNDPLTQYGQWVNFPDIAPGETATETVVFVARPGFNLGNNPTPQIIFSTDKDNK
jgi:hypothetical protein